MDRKTFIDELTKMDNQEILDYIRNNGKEKIIFAFTIYDDDGNIIDYNSN